MQFGWGGVVHGDQVLWQLAKWRAAFCGSEPARESSGSVEIDVECPTVFASRLAPTGESGGG
ncbi:hypothetical protein PG5_55660 [Pseudomonas sp. G5(2012)]|nr:hypothetical protein PG5_55660 [Pseudomonas sp. G5(2012)]